MERTDLPRESNDYNGEDYDERPQDDVGRGPPTFQESASSCGYGGKQRLTRTHPRYYTSRMPEPVAWIAASVLAASFAWAAAAKVFRWAPWRAALGAYRLPRTIELPVALAVPLAEAGVAVMVLAGPADAGASSALFLLACFTLAVLRARAARGDRLPCGCFGDLKDRDYRVMVLRNALLVVLCGAVLLGGIKEGLVSAVEPPAGADALPGVLVAVGVGVALWTVRQVAASLGRGRQP